MFKLFVLLVVCYAPILKADNIHLFLLADTNDWSIGTSCKTDYQNIKKLMEIVSKSVNSNLYVYEYVGNDLNSEKVTEKMQSLDSNKNDIIFFYYSGHGSYTGGETYEFGPYEIKGRYTQRALPTLSMEDKGLPLKDVLTVLADKKHRLFISVVDCCNNYVRNKSFTVSKDLFNSDDQQTKDKYKKLFGSYIGFVVFTGCEVGESSYCMPSGGYFTNSFLSAIYNSSFWGEIATKTCLDTYNLSKEQSHQQRPVLNSNFIVCKNCFNGTKTKICERCHGRGVYSETNKDINLECCDGIQFVFCNYHEFE